MSTLRSKFVEKLCGLEVKCLCLSLDAYESEIAFGNGHDEVVEDADGDDDQADEERVDWLEYEPLASIVPMEPYHGDVV